MVTDAFGIGSYQQIANPGSEPFAPVALPANSNVTIGPFDDTRSYRADLTVGESIAITIANNSGTNTVDLAPYQLIQNVTTLSTNGAITVFNGINKITKGSIGAYTLAAPTAAQEGMTFTVTNKTAFAHVITASSLINKGTTGGPFSTLTWPAFVGASITLTACNLLWNVVSNNAVVIA